jgi:gliding motility-associated-like protein
VHPQPEANFIVPDVCLNDAYAQFTDSSFIADGSPLQYLWHFGDANATAANPDSSVLKDPTHKYSATGYYKTTLKVSSVFGCTALVAKTFSVNGSFPVAAFVIKDSDQLCSNTSVQLQNTSTVLPGIITRIEITWDAVNASGITEVDESPYGGKLYLHQYPVSMVTNSYVITFRAYSGQSCASEVTKIITINGSPKLVFSAIPDICFSDPPRVITEVNELSGLPGTGVFSGTAFSSAGVFDPAQTNLTRDSGTYKVSYKYTTDKGCMDTASSSITVWKVTADAGADVTVLEGNSASLHPIVTGTSTSYQWTPDKWLNSNTALYAVAQPLDNITYTLKVTGKAGCTASDTVAVKVLKQPLIPNVFSPNGDGINDTWYITYLDVYPQSTVQVYNRYGAMVFNCHGTYKPWDGTFQGKPVPVGVYYYIVDAGSGRSRTSGWVTVLR